MNKKTIYRGWDLEQTSDSTAVVARRGNVSSVYASEAEAMANIDRLKRQETRIKEGLSPDE